MQGEYELLKETLHFFIQNSYSIWKAKNELKKEPTKKDSILHPAYMNRFNELMDFETARNITSENRFMGTLEYPVLYPGDSEYEWHEINVFIDTEEDGTRVANILGRDITAAHEQQEIKERELRASTARDQLLSGVTKLLYSYNMTVNVNNGTYTLIIGTGLTDVVEVMKTTD